MEVQKNKCLKHAHSARDYCHKALSLRTPGESPGILSFSARMVVRDMLGPEYAEFSKTLDLHRSRYRGPTEIILQVV